MCCYQIFNIMSLPLLGQLCAVIGQPIAVHNCAQLVQTIIRPRKRKSEKRRNKCWKLDILQGVHLWKMELPFYAWPCIHLDTFLFRNLKLLDWLFEMRDQLFELWDQLFELCDCFFCETGYLKCETGYLKSKTPFWISWPTLYLH